MINEKHQHKIALIMLIVTAIVWGTGFLFADSLLANGFNDVPIALNAIRFVCGAVALLIIFGKKLRFTKDLLIFGIINGVLLCGGFSLQLIGLKYTTPAACGFYTAAYTLFVPFLAWIILKKRPTLITWPGIVTALAGLVLLNLQSIDKELALDKNVLFGNLLTLVGSLFFALQIVLADISLHKKQVDNTNLTVVQVTVCAVLMGLISLIFESKHYSSLQINWGNSWWKLAIVSILGTAFAYFSQTYAQMNLSPTETSIVIAIESPVGAVLSVVMGIDKFSWQLCVGGLLVLCSVVLIEILPNVIAAKRKPPTPKEIPDADTNNTNTQ